LGLDGGRRGFRGVWRLAKVSEKYTPKDPMQELEEVVGA
jgi:hypothetical protein